MYDIITSDFLWGIIIGLILTLVGALFLHERQERQKRKAVVRFIEDVVQSIDSYVEQLDTERQTNNEVINSDYLSLISGEIELYARNREHLIHIPIPELRSEIKAFITDVAIKTARIQNPLNEFYKWWEEAQKLEDGSAGRNELEASARAYLETARLGVDRLRDFMARERITQKLQQVK